MSAKGGEEERDPAWEMGSLVSGYSSSKRWIIRWRVESRN